MLSFGNCSLGLAALKVQRDDDASEGSITLKNLNEAVRERKYNLGAVNSTIWFIFSNQVCAGQLNSIKDY